ncbi:MAG: hypothetical protein M4579_001444 [Chaenotheca gracillima]|nr:MAG: hypothetical protein M4579_001444 [Chaenotheca gracillima]
MPRIEVVPNSTTSANAPGWAYVPDTGYDPSKAPLQPAANGGRHRAARNAGTAAGRGAADRSARENNAILKRLADLDRDSHRDVHIAVPTRKEGAGGRGSRAKAPSVRKILTSAKTFANHIADEEAAIAQSLNQAHPPPKTSNAQGARAKKRGPNKKETLQQTDDPTDINDTPMTSSRDDDDDNHPLLKPYVPVMPPKEILDELLSAPPLSYAAARASPSSSGLPQRHFCEICGYWGRVKCVKCGARVCGLDCKRAHDESKCLRFYS